MPPPPPPELPRPGSPALTSPLPTRPGADPTRLRRLGALARRLWFLEDDLALLPRLVPEGATCVDVGANRGAYTLACALLAGSGGRVVGLEPQPGPLRTARALRAALRLDQVELHEIALSDVPGRLSLVVPTRFGLPVYGRAFLADAPDLSADDLAEFHDQRRRLVEVTTLDALAEDLRLTRLDFLKADVEGAELRMLRGAAATIERHRPVILLEIEDRHVRKYGHAADDVLREVTAHGYTACVQVGAGSGSPAGGLVRVERVTPGARNYLLLPEESASSRSSS